MKFQGSVILGASGRVNAYNVASQNVTHNGRVSVISNLLSPTNNPYKPGVGTVDPNAIPVFGYLRNNSILTSTNSFDSYTTHPMIGQMDGGTKTQGVLNDTFWNQGSVVTPKTFRVEARRLSGIFTSYDQIFIVNNTASTVQEVVLKVGSGLMKLIPGNGAAGELGPNEIFTTTIATSSAFDINMPIVYDTVPDGLVDLGADASFEVRNPDGGGVLTYQWQVNTGTGFQNILGATSELLSVPEVTNAMNGYMYRCQITDNTHMVSTNEAKLNVRLNATGPTPAGGNIYEEENYQLSVTAGGGNGDYTYQWLKGGVPLSDGGSISGAQAATLVFTGAVLDDTGDYSCQIMDTGAVPSITTSSVYLGVFKRPVVTISGPVFYGKLGDPVSVQVTVEGGIGMIQYQWERDEGGGFIALSDGGSISGVDTATLSVDPLAAEDDNDVFHCVVRDEGSSVSGITSVTSDPSTLMVQITVTGAAPAAIRIYVMESVSFSVTASGGDGNYAYQWLKDGETLTDGGVVSGALESTLVLSGVSVTDTGAYTCLVSEGRPIPAVSSEPGVLEVFPLLALSGPPELFSGEPGGSASTAIVPVGGIPPFTMHWERDSGSGFSPLSNGGNIGGADTDTLQINPVSMDDNLNDFRCVVTDSGSDISGTMTVTSGISRLYVGEWLTIINHTEVVEKYVDDPPFMLTGEYTGGFSSLQLQWYQHNLAYPDPTLVVDMAPTENIVTLTVDPSLIGTGQFEYYYQVSDFITRYEGNSPVSEPSPVTVADHMNIEVHTEGAVPNGQGGYDLSVPIGSTVEMSVTITGGLGELSRQWTVDDGAKEFVPLSDGNGLSGTTTNTFTIASAMLEDAGQYRIEVSDNYETAVSPIIHLMLETGVPVTGLGGMLVLTAASAVSGLIVVRRRRK